MHTHNLAELPESHQMLRKTLHEFSDKELAPKAAKVDRDQVYPVEQVRDSVIIRSLVI